MDKNRFSLSVATSSLVSDNKIQCCCSFGLEILGTSSSLVDDLELIRRQTFNIQRYVHLGKLFHVLLLANINEL